MIPLKDNNPTRRPPFVNIVLILLNIAAFIYEVSLGRDLEGFLNRFGVVPNVLSGSAASAQFVPGVFLTLFTSMFLHGGWLHLGGNMLYLWIFGDNVEDKLGHGKYLVFYLLCGLAATFAQLAFSLGSNIPNL